MPSHPGGPNQGTFDYSGEVNPLPETGSTCGEQRYELGEEIGSGGMGVVYRAKDKQLQNRDVAVKTFRRDKRWTRQHVDQFRDEAYITAQLQHPNIPPVFDLGTLSDGRPFLAMKLIKGSTLEKMLGEQPDPSRYLVIFEQVTQAVAYAHDHNIIHRDLKPLNVMVGAFGEVQVMDWGLAKMLPPAAPQSGSDLAPKGLTVIQSLREPTDPGTNDGIVKGTPEYMSPEQARGEKVAIDRRTDVFSLGAILYRVLTGQPLYQVQAHESSGETRVALLCSMAKQGPTRSTFKRLESCSADSGLISLFRWCLEIAYDDRLANAGCVAEEIAKLRAKALLAQIESEIDKRLALRSPAGDDPDWADWAD
jgi:eukaryotic-like serine/threonine-protein kinase